MLREATLLLGAIACTACAPPSAASVLAAPVAIAVDPSAPRSDASAPATPADPPLPAYPGHDPYENFVHAGNRDVEPEDPGVLAPADAPLLKSSTERARTCLGKAKVKGRVHVKVSLSDEGRPSAEPLDADRWVPGMVVKCVLGALAQGRYTRPGTKTPEGITKRFILVRIEFGMEPQEYQVD